MPEVLGFTPSNERENVVFCELHLSSYDHNPVIWRVMTVGLTWASFITTNNNYRNLQGPRNKKREESCTISWQKQRNISDNEDNFISRENMQYMQRNRDEDNLRSLVKNNGSGKKLKQSFKGLAGRNPAHVEFYTQWKHLSTKCNMKPFPSLIGGRNLVQVILHCNRSCRGPSGKQKTTTWKSAYYTKAIKFFC